MRLYSHKATITALASIDALINRVDSVKTLRVTHFAKFKEFLTGDEEFETLDNVEYVK